MNKLYLGLRFILEVAMIVIAAIWGWNNAEGLLKFILALGIPALMATLWGVFAVRGDPSRSGKTIVQTPGVARLFLELIFFGLACWFFYDLGYHKLSLILVVLLAVHYIFSFDRIRWLLKQKSGVNS